MVFQVALAASKDEESLGTLLKTMFVPKPSFYNAICMTHASCHPLVMHDSVRLFYRHFKPYQASHFNITLFMSDIERLLETRTFRIITSQHLTLSISPSLKQLSLDLSI